MSSKSCVPIRSQLNAMVVHCFDCVFEMYFQFNEIKLRYAMQCHYFLRYCHVNGTY